MDTIKRPVLRPFICNISVRLQVLPEASDSIDDDRSSAVLMVTDIIKKLRKMFPEKKNIIQSDDPIEIYALPISVKIEDVIR